MVIDAIDGVEESAVIGVPHPDFGEGVVAVELAAFKRRKTAIIVDELPRNAMGKVQKTELRKLHNDLFARTAARATWSRLIELLP